jgi:hypothetical protein
MGRFIQSNYAGKCRQCKSAHAVGTRVYWSKGVRGVLCEKCASASPISTPAIPAPAESIQVFDIAEVKSAVAKALAGDYRDFAHQNTTSGAYPVNADSSFMGNDWAGFTKTEFSEWLSGGFKTDVFSGLEEFSPPIRQKRRRFYSEDSGEMQIDLVLAGEDNPFVDFTPRDVIPGFAVNIWVDFHAGVNASVIEAYQRWVARTLYTLETEGIDLEINVVCRTRNPYTTTKNGEVNETRIRVKRANEVTAFSDWSVMFSPAGFRGMMFACLCLHAGKVGKAAAYGLGQPTSHSWGVKLNAEDRVLVFSCDSGAREFPEDNMTAQLHAAIRNVTI